MSFKKEIKKRMIDIDINRWVREPENVKLSDLTLLLRALKYTEEEAAGMVKKIQSEAWG